MTRSHVVLAFGMSSFAGLAGVTSASAQVVYVDEGAYAVPPAYMAPAVPPGYYVAPQGHVAAPAYTYTVPTAPLAMVPVAPPAYAAAPGYVERVVPAITPRQRVMRRVIVERRPAYPRYDYGYDSGYDPGYVTYEER
jgi:hypothetical protein